MGRVGVLRKQAEQNNSNLMVGGGQGTGGLLMGIPGSVTAEDAAGGPNYNKETGQYEGMTGAMGRHFERNPNAFFNRNVAARDTNFTPQQMGRVQQGAQRTAAKFGGIGGALGAAFGGINRLYDATSSGQPGALSAGAMGAWTGQQMAQPYATRFGAEVGVKRGARNERRGEKVAVKNAADARQRQESLADPNYTGRLADSAPKPHTSKGGEGMVRDHAFGSYSPVAKPTFDGSMFDAPAPSTSPQYPPALQRRIDNTKNSPEAVGVRETRVADRVASANRTLAGGPNLGTLGNLGGSGSPNIFNSNYGNTQRHAGIMEGLKTPVADPTLGTDPLGGLGESMGDAGITGNNPPPPQTTQTNLGHYPTNNKVAVLDAEKLRALENDGVDASGNKVSGTAEVQG
jgi:hypothetical protein